jgi:hypothetical protein
MTTDAQSATNKNSLLSAFSPYPEHTNLAEDSTAWEWIDSLNDYDLADCVFRATVRGNEHLVRTIMARRGPVPIQFEQKKSDTPQCFLNGQEVKLPDKSYFDANTPAALKSLLSMIRDFGMKGLIDPGASYPQMLSWIDYEEELNKHNLSHFDGELPTLSSGVLLQPELVIALANDIQSSPTPEAYKPVLCWATQEMVREFAQQLAPLRPFQVLNGKGFMEEYEAKPIGSECLSYSKITVGLKPSANTTKFAPLLVETMGPVAAKMGFDDLQSRVLCETTVNFLLQFPADACTAENYALAENFVAHYCPMSIIGLQAHEICVRDFDHQGRQLNFKATLDLQMEKAFNPLFMLLAKDNPLQERAMGMMRRDQWLNLIKKTDTTYLYPESLLAIRDSLGLDNAGMHIKIDYPGFKKLVAGGYRFADNTKFFSQEREFKRYNNLNPFSDSTSMLASMTAISVIEDIATRTDPERVAVMLTLYKDMLLANLWPVENHEKPETLEEIMGSVKYADFDDYRDAKAMTVHSYLTLQGVDACAKVATTTEHWTTLAAVFSPDELKPYLGQIPGKVKGQLIEQALGL